MPFRFFNLPASFYSYINMILAKKLDFFIIIYLNNIIIYIKNLGQSDIKVVKYVLNII